MIGLVDKILFPIKNADEQFAINGDENCLQKRGRITGKSSRNETYHSKLYETDTIDLGYEKMILMIVDIRVLVISEESDLNIKKEWKRGMTVKDTTRK